MKKLRISERTVNGKTVFVIQKKLSLLFFNQWLDLDEDMKITRSSPHFYEDRIEARNNIKFS